MKTNDGAMPELEMFFGIIYAGYCGSCGRMMFTGGSFRTKQEASEQIKACPWCKHAVKWAVNG